MSVTCRRVVSNPLYANQLGLSLYIPLADSKECEVFDVRAWVSNPLYAK